MKSILTCSIVVPYLPAPLLSLPVMEYVTFLFSCMWYLVSVFVLPVILYFYLVMAWNNISLRISVPHIVLVWL